MRGFPFKRYIYIMHSLSRTPKPERRKAKVVFHENDFRITLKLLVEAFRFKDMYIY